MTNDFLIRLLVDDFSDAKRTKTCREKFFQKRLTERIYSVAETIITRLVQFIFHIGASTDTSEFNKEIFDRA